MAGKGWTCTLFAMKRSVILVAGVIAVLVGGFLLLRYRSPDSYRWERFESPDGKFSISLPGKPVGESEVRPPEGAPKAHSWNVRPRADAAYGCSWWDDSNLSSQPVDVVLDKARDLGVAGARGLLVSETRIAVKGYPAREVKAVLAGNLTYEDMLIVVGNRVYSLMVIYRDESREGANVQKFFASFTPL